MSITSVQRIYRRAKHAAGIKKGSGIHTLRHCFATHLLEQGVDIYHIKNFMGHKSVNTTAIYLHLRPDRLMSIQSPLDPSGADGKEGAHEPHLLNPVISCNKKECLGLLFQAVNEVLVAFARDPQWRLEGRIGFIGILHTWSQTLMDHFHLHCLIPAGVLSFDETRWTPTRKKFLFRTSSLGKAFRRIYLEKLRHLYDHQALKFPGKAAVHGTPEGFESLLRAAFRKKWVIFAKRPFSGPAEVLKYLGRYTHRVAISNHRIVSIGNKEVAFTYRDRRDNDHVKQMTVDALAFIRRFLRYVLPDGFMKIRYFGFLSHRHKCRCIPLIRSLIGPGEKPPVKSEDTIAAIIMRLTGADITCCPECGGRLRSYPLPVTPEMMEATPANTS